MNEKEQLNNQIRLCKIKLERANILTGSLADESLRWAADVEILKKTETLLPGDSIIAAGMVVYAGPFVANYR